SPTAHAGGMSLHITSSEAWVVYYQTNSTALLEIPWDCGADLSDADRELIVPSVQIFQLGESSEGRHLYQRSKEWADANDDPAYIQAIRLFIAEEQRHAADLGRVLCMNNIPLMRRSFTY